MPESDFVHLHVHTHFSLLDGVAKESALIAAAVRCKMPALAITDHGNMFGATVFYKAAKAAGIKPIIGYEAYVAPESRHTKKVHPTLPPYWHMTLLVKNEAGYKNMCKLATIAYTEGFYYRPRIDHELLKEHAEGIIALSGCLSSELSFFLRNDQRQKAIECINFHREILGEDNFYLEIQDHGIPAQEKVIKGTVELAEELGVKLVATNDVHYISRKDYDAQDVLICISTGKTRSDEKRMRMDVDQFYFKTPQEMGARFGKYPGAIENTLEIAEKCNFDFTFGKYHIPMFTPPDKKTPEDYLRELCLEGLKERYDVATRPEVMERFEYEFGVIRDMGFVSYFLVTWDFINYAKSENIPVGPGRGSAAGSIVAYSLGITDVDPIRFGLLFERFLNKERVSMPDIDIDFCMERREDVIDYVRKKYGTDNVAQIITFGTLGSKAVIRDVGRVLDIPLGEVDKIAKKVQTGQSLSEALASDPDLKKMRNSREYKELFAIAERLEGLNRHSGVHAAGVVITDKPLVEYIPLAKEGDNLTTQFDMGSIEEIGLLKVDFLGLRTLTTIEKAQRNIEATTGERLDFSKIPLDDKKTYEMLTRAESEGVFQLESSGMKGLLRAMRPDTFEDLSALIALYRPGPLGSGMHEMFVRRKHGEEEVEYPHPDLEEILKPTYGTIVYQEQVMQISAKLSGFTLNQADSLRKAMSKKKPEILAKFKDMFVDGAAQRGVDKKKAAEIFELIEYFAGYGFNKSHTIAYAIVAYQTAYLKAHHPTEFMAALLSTEMGSSDKVKEYCEELKALEIRLLPPDVNASFWEFTVAGVDILYGLGGIKGVGQKGAESISATREEGGPFKSIYDFTERVDLQAANKGAIEGLIKVGAFDSLGARRAQLIEVLQDAVRMGQDVQRTRKSGQGSLFDMMNGGAADADPYAKLPDIPEWPDKKMLAEEKEHLGFWLTAHPLEEHRRLLATYATHAAKDLSDARDGAVVLVGGMITGVRRHITKKGQPMAFLALEDLTGPMDAVVFPDLFEKSVDLLEEDRVHFFAGTLDTEREPPSIKVHEIIPAEDVRQKLSARACITLDVENLNEDTIKELKGVLKSHTGKCPLFLRARREGVSDVLLSAGMEFNIDVTDELSAEVERLLGENAFKVQGREASKPPPRKKWRKN